jgi:hypothetical protein
MITLLVAMIGAAHANVLRLLSQEHQPCSTMAKCTSTVVSQAGLLAPVAAPGTE